MSLEDGNASGDWNISQQLLGILRHYLLHTLRKDSCNIFYTPPVSPHSGKEYLLAFAIQLRMNFCELDACCKDWSALCLNE